MRPETRLEIATRLVAEAEALVAQQQQLVAELGRNGRGTDSARRLLFQFDRALESFRRTLALLQSDARRSN
jgi:hypothetical protein